MGECCVCRKKIGLFGKKRQVSEKEFCHEDCWFETKTGKVYLSTINARAHFINKKDKEALKEIDKGLSLQENNLDLLALKAGILGNQGKPKESLDYAKRAYERFEQLYGKGFIKKQLEKTRSEEISQDWIMQNNHLADEYGNILRALALNYLALKQYEKAIPHLKEEIEIYPDFIEAFDDLAKCYYQLKKFKEAEFFFKKSLELEGCPKEIIEREAKKNFAKKSK